MPFRTKNKELQGSLNDQDAELAKMREAGVVCNDGGGGGVGVFI